MAEKRNKPSWNKITPTAILLYGGKSKESGIYQIKHIGNNRKYIGSAARFEERWKSHLSGLRNGTHFNKFLQNDFTKSGEDKFEFSILEIVVGTRDDRQRKEQEYLDVLWANTDKKQRYNHSSKAIITEPKLPKEKSYRKDWYWFLAPDGVTEYVVERLTTFCHEYGLNRSKMNRLATGDLEKYKGWRTVVPDNKKIVFINTKTEEEISFSREFENNARIASQSLGVDSSHLSKLVAGKRKSCGDWKVKNRVVVPRPYRGKTYRLVSPEGKVVKFNNLHRFALDNNLSASRLLSLLKGSHGKKHVLSYKGWIRYGQTHQDVEEKRKSLIEARQNRLKTILKRDPVTGQYLPVGSVASSLCL